MRFLQRKARLLPPKNMLLLPLNLLTKKRKKVVILSLKKALKEGKRDGHNNGNG